jgi:hypothetical protein
MSCPLCTNENTHPKSGHARDRAKVKESARFFELQGYRKSFALRFAPGVSSILKRNRSVMAKVKESARFFESQGG